MATPRRSARSRSATPSAPAAPLPAVKHRPSAAYGAKGRAALKSQLQPSDTGFGDEFQTSRAPRASPIPEEEEDDEEPAMGALPDRSKTGLAPEEAYGAATTARRGAQMAAAPPPPRARAGSPVRVTRVGQQNNIRLWDALAGYFFLLYFLFASIALSGVVLRLAPLPAAWESYREDFFGHLKASVGMTQYGRPPEEVELRWYHFMHDKIYLRDLPLHNMPERQWAININMYGRMEKIEARLDAIEGNVTLLTETQAMLNDILPNLIAVKRHPNGAYEIPYYFWAAFESRLRMDSQLGEKWHEFWTGNEREIERRYQEAANEQLDEAIVTRDVITKENFVEALKANNDFLMKEYKEVFSELIRGYATEVKDVASRTANEALERSEVGNFARQQLETLTKANIIHNTYQALRAVNFFSLGLGANIDLDLTTQTAGRKAKGALQRIYLSVMPMSRPANPPLIALMHWNEATECWCGGLENGTTSIAVTMHKRVYPDTLVIEHIPALGTLEIASAPQEIEIWAEAGSKAEAQSLTAAIKQSIPWHEDRKCTTAPPNDNFVCIGSGKYDIHQSNHIQLIQTFVDSKDLGLSTRKIVVRARKNWGSTSTCFYRLRMTGIAFDQSPSVELLDEPLA